MSEPQLRAKVRRGLLKVEQLHALARAVYYGQRGRISAREVYDQMNACSCLTLILACIVYWQAREISRLAAAPDFPVDPDLLRHVSPIEWKRMQPSPPTSPSSPRRRPLTPAQPPGRRSTGPRPPLDEVTGHRRNDAFGLRKGVLKRLVPAACWSSPRRGSRPSPALAMADSRAAPCLGTVTAA